MGLRGPPPKPTALRILEGNPGRRPLNRHEPKPTPVGVELPRAYRWLDREAKAEWARTAPVLVRMDLLTEADVPLLVVWCDTWSLMLGYRQRLRLHSGDKDARVALEKARSDLLRIAQHFGLSPSARSRLVVLQDDDSDTADW